MKHKNKDLRPDTASPVEEIEVSPGRFVKSVDKREEFISGIVRRINHSLGVQP